MTVLPLFQPARDGRSAPAGRAATLSAQIVAEVTDALLEKRLAPGDFLGGEKDIASRAGVSRIVARDALRTLEALGVVDIRMGSGGGARIAAGNPRRFAEALAIQLALTGVGAGEILDAQRAIECQAAELAAAHATASDLARLQGLVDGAASLLDDSDGFTRAGQDFHLAVAEASHNRVLVFHLVSLQHVSWPRRNRTLTRTVAAQVLAAHRELLRLVAAGDGAGARRLMDAHLRMIRARRVAEHGDAGDCC
jgi:GntR family transcriptional repressor for pyruvate dehydrogenase complex